MHHPEAVHDTAPPLTWIRTQGNVIPPNAVPFRTGPNGSLYIARCFQRGDLCIGAASRAYDDGARVRDGDGWTYEVFEYEVLTCASRVRFQLEPPQPPAWLPPRAGSTPPPCPPAPAPRPARDDRRQRDPPPYKERTRAPPKQSAVAKRREQVQFKRFACFTLIDDGPSTREALAGVVEALSVDDTWDGMNVRFLQHADADPCVKTLKAFEGLFDSVSTWTGQKVMADKVAQVFAESLALIQDTPDARPVVLLIVTDGMAADAEPLFDVVVRFCQTLNELGVGPHAFTIYVLQMGSDRKAVQPLHDFRDRVTQRDRERRILDVVSFHRGRGLLNAEHILKLLVASTHVPVEQDPRYSERQTAAVVAAQYQALDSIRMMGNA